VQIINLRIRNYRTLLDVNIDTINHFNLFIGKNNSGKSTVLSAIQAVYSILSNGSVVNLKPVIGTLRDFHSRPDDRREGIPASTPPDPISLTATFRFEPGFYGRFAAKIIDGNPGLKTAVEATGEPHSLVISINIEPAPRSFSFVHKITIHEKSPTEGGRSWTLLEVPPAVAHELCDVSRTIMQVEQDQRLLKRMIANTDAADWNAARRGGPREEIRYGGVFNVLRRYGEELSPHVMRAAEKLFEDGSTYDEFRSALEELAAAEGARARSAKDLILANNLTTFGGEDRKIPEYVAYLLSEISKIKVTYLTEYRKPIGAEEAQRLLLLKTRRGGGNTFSTIQRTVSDLLGVRVDAYSSEQPSRQSPAAELDVDDFLAEVNGSGIREALRLVLDTSFERPNVLLVEEPEIHLHPALETSMMRYLRDLSESSQVFISTHSTNFVDHADTQNVYLVSKERATTISLLEYREIEEKVPQELGVRLSSLFFYDRLVFVEGPSDELVLRQISDVLEVKLNQSNVGFILLRGIGNLGHYAAKEILSFLSKRQVRLWFFVDRDERAEEEIAVMKERLGGGAILFPTRSRELENYLLNPSANVRHLKNRFAEAGAADNSPTEAEFSELLTVKADHLKSYTILKHAIASRKPIYPARDLGIDLAKEIDVTPVLQSEINASLETLSKEAEAIKETVDVITKDINARWEKDKLDLVPGSILLDQVYKEYGLRFEKLRDSPQLAKLMRAEDVDRELAQLIRTLGNEG
jgi:putative ATP-dependent endonuclease of OLD family